MEAFAVLEPTFDGFRNYLAQGHQVPAEVLLVERAQMLTLTAPELTVLVGGLRVLNANAGQSALGVFTTRPGTLSADFFVNLLDMGTEWKPTSEAAETLRGPRSRHGCAHLEREPRRPPLRVELRTPCPGGGLRVRRRAGEVRARLRGRVEQGHEPRSIRPRLIAPTQVGPRGRPASSRPPAQRPPLLRPPASVPGRPSWLPLDSRKEHSARLLTSIERRPWPKSEATSCRARWTCWS